MGISHELSEEDVKFRYINEAITSKGWTKEPSQARDGQKIVFSWNNK